MKAAPFAVCAFKAMRAEKVALRLYQIGRAAPPAHRFKIGQRGGKRGHGDTGKRGLCHQIAQRSKPGQKRRGKGV